MKRVSQKKQKISKDFSRKSPSHSRIKQIVWEYAKAFLIAAAAALFIRTFFIQSYRIPTSSMEDSLLVGDFLLVNKFIYGAKIPLSDWRLPKIRDPRQGDAIVFKYPRDEKLDYIKRLIALPGQIVEIKNKVVYVDGRRFESPGKIKFIDSQIKPLGIRDYGIFPHDAGNRDNYGPIIVPDGHYFVMGDNRDNSSDSRYWGFLPRENVIGKALIIYFSWDSELPIYHIFSKIRWSRICDLVH